MVLSAEVGLANVAFPTLQVFDLIHGYPISVLSNTSLARENIITDFSTAKRMLDNVYMEAGDR